MTLQRYEHRYTSMETSEHGAWVLADDADTEIARLNHELESLNEMLRQTGYGQGQIDAYDAQCVEIAELKARCSDLSAAILEIINSGVSYRATSYNEVQVSHAWYDAAHELLKG